MSLTADYVNFIVYRYLQESGFVHAAYALRAEVGLATVDVEHDDVAAGALLTLLQRGLQYLELEANAAGGDAVDAKFEALAAADILRAKAPEELKRLVRERRDDETSSRSKPRAPPAARAAQCAAALACPEEQMFAARWSPNGDVLACQGGRARLWHVGATGCSTGAAGVAAATERAQGAVTLRRGGDTTPLSSPAVWRPDGAQVATGMEDGSVRLWRHTGARLTHAQSAGACAGELEHTLLGHKDAILELAYSPDGSKLLSASAEPYIVVWDPQSGRELARAATHADAVADVAWRDDATFASSSYDREVHVLRLRQAQQGGADVAEAMDMDADADARAGAEAGPRTDAEPAAAWEVRKLRTLAGHSDDVVRVAWAPNSWLLASCASEHAKLWSMHQTGSLCDLTADDIASAHNDHILALAFRPAGTGSRNPGLALQLATAGDDCLVRLWDCENGGLMHNLAGHKQSVRSCAWAPDGRTLATGSFDSSVMLWDPSEGKAAKQYSIGAGVFDVCWNPDGRRLSACSKSGHVYVLDTRM